MLKLQQLIRENMVSVPNLTEQSSSGPELEHSRRGSNWGLTSMQDSTEQASHGDSMLENLCCIMSRLHMLST